MDPIIIDQIEFLPLPSQESQEINDFAIIDSVETSAEPISVDIQKEDAFATIDNNIDLQECQAILNNCNSEALTEVVERLGWEQLYDLICSLFIKFDINPREYSKEQFDSLLKLILQLLLRLEEQNNTSQELQNILNTANSKIEYLENIIFQLGDIQLPLQLNISYDSSNLLVGETYTKTVKVQALFKGENVNKEASFYLDNELIYPVITDDYAEIIIICNKETEGLLTKTIKVVIPEAQNLTTINFQFVYPIFYGLSSFTFDTSKLDLYTSNTKELTTKISIEDRKTTFVYSYPKFRGPLTKILDENSLNCILDFTNTEEIINNIPYLTYWRTEKDPLDQIFTFQ